MRLVTYRHEQGWRAGVLAGDLVVDAAYARSGSDGARAVSTRELLRSDPRDREGIAAAAQEAARSGSGVVGALADLELGPPVPDPEKIFCLGLNYRDHAVETALDVQAVPTLFTKFRNALVGSGQAIVLPPMSDQVDFEGELAVVINRRVRNVGEARALDCVGGYMPFNDVSARDLQMSTSQWTAGKVPDTFAPCGPALVLSDEVADPQALRISTRVNGATLQSASTADMMFGIAETVSYISRLVTLEVGDIIATGTPAGVGYTRRPPVFLGAGDTVEVEIEGLGTLSNPVATAARPSTDHGALAGT